MIHLQHTYTIEIRNAITNKLMQATGKVIKRVKDALKEKQISEDDARQGEEKIQKLTDQFIKEVEKHLEEKEADLLSM